MSSRSSFAPDIRGKLKCPPAASARNPSILNFNQDFQSNEFQAVHQWSHISQRSPHKLLCLGTLYINNYCPELILLKFLGKSVLSIHSKQFQEVFTPTCGGYGSEINDTESLVLCFIRITKKTCRTIFLFLPFREAFK